MTKLIATDPSGSLIQAAGVPSELAMVPDYANMEAANRIAASGRTWTVDRTGFVNCESYVYASNTLASGVYLEARILLNNIIVSTDSTKDAVSCGATKLLDGGVTPQHKCPITATA